MRGSSQPHFKHEHKAQQPVDYLRGLALKETPQSEEAAEEALAA